MRALLKPTQIISIVDKMERVIRAAGPKPCGLTLSQHDWLLGQAEDARRALSLMVAPTQDFDTLGNAAGRGADGAREAVRKP